MIDRLGGAARMIGRLGGAARMISRPQPTSSLSKVFDVLQIQALVYDILPPTIAITGYALGVVVVVVVCLFVCLGCFVWLVGWLVVVFLLLLLIIIIMYIYHALINALSAHMIHINLNMIFYTHVEHSPIKTIYIKYYNKK